MPSQYRAIWTVPGGGTGYSVFHSDDATDGTDAQEFADNIRIFFAALASSFPDDIQINFDSEVVTLDLGGSLVATWAVTPPLVVNGTSTAAYNRAAGLRVDWQTGTIVAGRRLNGRTYFVPSASTAFDTEGQVIAATTLQYQNAANALIANMLADGIPLEIWSRTHGVSQPVVTASVPAFGAILRGRRD